MEAIMKFDKIIDDISVKCNPRPHKRLKFVKESCTAAASGSATATASTTSTASTTVTVTGTGTGADLKSTEDSLADFLTFNATTVEQLEALKTVVAIPEIEHRICEYLVFLIKHGEERIDRHVELFKEVLSVIRKLKENDPGDELRETAIEKCSLMIYDSFHFLCDVKRILREVCSRFQVPIHYDTDKGTVRLRTSVLSVHKNLNTIIDDLQTLNEGLWYVRHYDCLSNI